MATIAEQTPLEFHCGVCARELTDASCLFTSCGHFYCLGNRCTALTQRSRAEKCEQCGKRCDAGTLEDKAAKLDEHTRRFVFANVEEDLKAIVEVTEFRKQHNEILRDRTATLLKTNTELKEEIYQVVKERGRFKKEVEQLRTENTTLRKQLRRVVSRPPNVYLSKATNTAQPHPTTHVHDKPSERYQRGSEAAPSMRTETAVNRRTQERSQAPIMQYVRNRPVDPRRRRQSPRRTELKGDRRTAYAPTMPYRDSTLQTNNLTAHNSTRAPIESKPSNYTSVRAPAAVQPISRGGTLLKKRPTYGGAQSYTERRGADLSKSYGAPSTQYQSKTDKLLRRSESKPTARAVPSYGKSLYTSSRTQRKPLGPSTVTKFKSTRVGPRARAPPAPRSTRVNGASWKSLPLVKSRLPRPTAMSDHWKETRKKRSNADRR